MTNCLAPGVDQANIWVDGPVPNPNQCNTLAIGNYPNAAAFDLPDTSISAVQLGSNVEMVVYSEPDFRGRPIVVRQQPEIPFASMANDSTRSLKVRRISACPASPGSNQVIVYEGVSYSGRCTVLDAGEYRDWVEMGIANNSLRSFKVGSNMQLTTYADESFAGTATEQTGDVSSISAGTSSLKVRWLTSCPNPLPSEVVVYEHGNYTGRCSVLKPGNYEGPLAMGIPNDSISSVKVGADVDVSLFEHLFSGSAARYTADTPTLPTFNDLASSLSVRWRKNCPNPRPNQAVVYENPNYDPASCTVLEKGDYAMPYTSGLANAFNLPNDSISSVKVGSSVTLVGFGDWQFGGTAVYLGDTPNLSTAYNWGSGATVNFDNAISSLRVSVRERVAPRQQHRTLVAACKLSDRTSEPFSMAHLRDVFLPDGAGKGGLYDNLMSIYYGQIEMTGSDVKGWLPMNVAESAGVGTIIDQCLAAAATAGATLANFEHFVVVTNGTMGPGSLHSSPGGRQAFFVTLEPSSGAINYIVHEWMHANYKAGARMHESRDSAGVDYGDTSDVMGSFLGTRYHDQLGFAGPELNALNRQFLGIMPSARVWKLPSSAGSTQVSLAPLNEERMAGSLAIHIPGSDAHPPLWVAYRKRTGFDLAVPEGVQIHEQRWDFDAWHSYIMAGPSGAVIQPGQTYTRGDVSITVNSVGSTASVTVAYTPSTVSFTTATTKFDGLFLGSAALSSWSPTDLHVFGRGTDSKIYHRWLMGSSWSSWEQMGSLAGESVPAAVSAGNERIDLFVRGSSNSLQHNFFDSSISSSWSGWSSVNVQTLDAPAVASWHSGRFDLFVRGTAETVLHAWKLSATTALSSFEELGRPSACSSLSAAPAAVSWAQGRVDVFVTCAGSLFQQYYDHGWSSWIAIDDNVTGTPTVSSWGAGRMHLFYRRTDGNYYEKSFAVDNWSNRILVSNAYGATPGVISRSVGSIDIIGASSNTSILGQNYVLTP